MTQTALRYDLIEDDEIWIDVQAFQRLVTSVRSHCSSPTETCPQCIAAFEKAAALYSDDFLDSFALRHALAFEEWQREQATILQAELKIVLARLGTALAKLAEFERAQRYIRQLLVINPYNKFAYLHLKMPPSNSNKLYLLLETMRDEAERYRHELAIQLDLGHVLLLGNARLW